MPVLLERYVDALFQTASKAGEVEAVGNDLRRLGEVLSDRRNRAILLDPRLPAAEKQRLFARLCEGMHALTGRFLELVLRGARGGILPHAWEAYRRQDLAARNTVEGVLETAAASDDAELESVRGAVAEALGKDVVLRVERNEDLLGGARLRVGHRMYDGSLRSRLEEARRRLLAARMG